MLVDRQIKKANQPFFLLQYTSSYPWQTNFNILWSDIRHIINLIENACLFNTSPKELEQSNAQMWLQILMPLKFPSIWELFPNNLCSSVSRELLIGNMRSLNTKTKKIFHQQILDCVIILLARPRTKNYSARISRNLVQLIRLFITVFTLTPPKVYTDPSQPIRPNNYITESPPNWHIYCHAELHSMDLQSIDLHADIQVFIWFASFKVNVFHC